jgi:hypothetical protein
MLSGLWHLSIGSGNDNYGTIHISGTSNHVLDVIGVTWAVDVRVMLGIGRVFDVCGRDGDTTLALLRSLINGTIVEEGREPLVGLSLCDGGCEGSLDALDADNSE